MEKEIFITTDFKRIDKRRWPKFVTDFLEEPKVSSLHRIVGKVFAKRFNTDSYPRIIFYEEIDEYGNMLYIPRKYFDRHEEYDKFNKQEQSLKESKFKYSSNEEEEKQGKFRQFIELERKPKLPIKMRDTFHVRDYSNKGQSYIFEMEDYCKHFKDKKFEDDKRIILESIQKVVIYKEYNEDEDGWIIEEFAKGKSIVMRIHNVDNHAYYYLFDVDTSICLQRLKKKYTNLDDEQLKRQARKGYPDWILYVDFDDWKKLENDEDSNLALSDEEVNVLNQTPYPFFVNGLAGSGKSTILHYLFANAYFHSLNNDKDMLFVSYSKKLVDKANQIVKALLKTGNHHIDEKFKLSEDDEKNLEKCFSPFQNYLIDNLLDTEEELTKFCSDKHVTFDIFQRNYEDDSTCNLHIKRNYNAVMVWSVIRTFIKGRDQHSFFTIDQYQKLPESDKTVGYDDYVEIYRIWSRWYKNFYSEHWDDIDLVRYVLNKIEDKKINIKKYDVIFCDEAQDFTPVEIKLIISLSKYSDYDMSEFTNIPIAIAGDPNQTVIPTGFSWKRLKDIFDKSFIDTIGHHISLHEKTLNNNYRSKKTIVEFANSIQFIRKCFLSDDALHPQDLWNQQWNPLPGLFVIDPNKDNQVTLGFDVAECIITGEDVEYDFSKENKKYVGNGDKTDKSLAGIKNKSKIYTAKSVKGLEFKSVILYKFANQLPNSFDKLLNNNQPTNGSEKYELAHFFTKLYIAITRAKDVIYIVDTQENYDRFWKHFIDNEFVEHLIYLRPESTAWDGKTCGVEKGKVEEYLKRLKAEFDPSDTARTIKDDAMLAEDSKLMRKAADYFNEAAETNEAEICLAYVMLFERNYIDAGKKFLSLALIEYATHAFWKGKCWNEILKLPSVSAERRLTAEYMTNQRSIMNFVSINNIVGRIKYEDETWKHVAMKVNHDAKGKFNDEQIYKLTSFLEELADKGFTFLSPRIAELFFDNRKFEKAIKYWDKTRNTEHKKYYEAKEAVSKSTSEIIYWMSRGGKSKEIMQKYSDPDLAKVMSFDERARRIIFQLLLSPNKFDKAIAYPYESDDKLPRLYRTDALQFIQKIVLKNFNVEDYYKWVEDPVTKNERNAFMQNPPESFFEAIFMLPETEDWIRFMRLSDTSGDRVMKYYENYYTIANTVNKILPKRNYYMPMASCFLDIVFNSPGYNHANAAKYTDTIVKLFTQNDFYRTDFRLVSHRNKYFESSGLKGSDVDYIKEHLREFAEKKISSYRRVRTTDFDTIKTLCHIVEKVVPVIEDEATGIFNDDLDYALEFYKRMLKLSQFPDELKKYFKVRMVIIEAQKDSRMSYGKLSRLIGEEHSLKNLIQTFDREDALWFIQVILGRRSISRQAINLLSIDLATLLYKHGFIMHEFNSKRSIRRNAETMVDKALEKVLSQDKIDEYALKLYAYIWEIVLEQNQDIAERYEKLSKNERLTKLYRLVEYLQRRSLYHYSYSSKELFNLKEEEYGIHESYEKIHDSRRPRIDEKPGKGSQKITVIGIDKDTEIGGISIELQARRKTIWFTKNGVDLLTIEKGKIKDSHDSVKVEGSAATISNDFRINITSESTCMVSCKNTLYEIRM